MGTPLFDLNQFPWDEDDIENEVDRRWEESRGDEDFNIDENDDVRSGLLDLNTPFVDEDLVDDEQGERGYQTNDDNHMEEDGIPLANTRRRHFLTNDQREKVYLALLERSREGKLKKTTTTEVSNLFSIPIRTVQRIWKLGQTNGGDVKHRKNKNCGNRKVHLDPQRLMEIDLTKRTTLRSLSESLGISHSALFRLFKEGVIRRHSNSIKPLLKDVNKHARLRFCLSMLEPNSVMYEPKFMGMYNVVHIDEKWFYLTKKVEKYYLHPMESDPLRTCQSKNFIGKVMFLVAMDRPRFDTEGNEIFSGKIGVFPLVTKEPALRRSRNREAGTLVTKPIPSITREVIRKFLIEKVIPSIQAVWPIEDARNTIWIQQDNARTHIDPNDDEFRRVASQNGFDIRLMCQPSNSPDLNILDLGFFSAIQSLQQKKKSTSVDELIEAVEKSFEEYSTTKINRTWITLQLCMIEIMKNGGSNRYKIPHVNKARMERLGVLPNEISCDPILVQNVRNQLDS